jgi:hypothetical protein
LVHLANKDPLARGTHAALWISVVLWIIGLAAIVRYVDVGVAARQGS